MNIGGFVRTLQVDFTALLSFLIVIGILTGLSMYLSGRLTDDLDETKRVRKITVLAASVLSALAFAIFLGHAILLGFSDRMPRSDVNKQPVYDQMESH